MSRRRTDDTAHQNGTEVSLCGRSGQAAKATDMMLSISGLIVVTGLRVSRPMRPLCSASPHSGRPRPDGFPFSAHPHGSLHLIAAYPSRFEQIYHRSVGPQTTDGGCRGQRKSTEIDSSTVFTRFSGHRICGPEPIFPDRPRNSLRRPGLDLRIHGLAPRGDADTVRLRRRRTRLHPTGLRQGERLPAARQAETRRHVGGDGAAQPWDGIQVDLG